LQVFEQGRKLAEGTGVTVGKTYGRTCFRDSLREIEREGADILCTTMGRLWNYVKDRLVDFSLVKFLVLDEADRLMVHDTFYRRETEPKEEDFITVLKNVLNDVNFPSKQNRRNFLFSATFPVEVQMLARLVLRDNNWLMVSNVCHISVSKLVQQKFVEVTQGPMSRYNLLVQFLHQLFDEQERDNVPRRVLIFVKKKRHSDQLAGYLCTLGIRATAINGDRRQEVREESLRDFYRYEKMVLVATDVMARGVDIKDLDHVVNFTMPHSHVVYVHRIGRVGRVKNGFATSFFDPRRREDQAMAPGLVELLQADGIEVPDFIRRTVRG